MVSFVCDTGTRYLSKVYNDQWMTDQGLLQRKSYKDLRDLIARRFEDGRVISVVMISRGLLPISSRASRDKCAWSE